MVSSEGAGLEGLLSFAEGCCFVNFLGSFLELTFADVDDAESEREDEPGAGSLLSKPTERLFLSGETLRDCGRDRRRSRPSTVVSESSASLSTEGANCTFFSPPPEVGTVSLAFLKPRGGILSALQVSSTLPEIGRGTQNVPSPVRCVSTIGKELAVFDDGTALTFSSPRRGRPPYGSAAGFVG